MRIAITASQPNLESPVDPRFGRCPYFIVADTETGEWEAVDNAQNVNAAQGAGVQAAQTVADRGAEAVVTGHCGPKAWRGLSAAGMQVYVNVEGTVAEAIERLKQGRLEAASGPDVEAHGL